MNDSPINFSLAVFHWSDLDEAWLKIWVPQREPINLARGTYGKMIRLAPRLRRAMLDLLRYRPDADERYVESLATTLVRHL